MKIRYLVTIGLVITCITSFAQTRWDERDSESLSKPFAIEDRAGGSHEINNLGLFFENRGKLYPRRITQGPSGEWPINTGMNYIFRINPMVGVKNNVVQARYTTNEEWEAVEGYHNREFAQIAMSDNVKTWHPENGWPVKDENGNPIIKSDQDSYAVYSDLNNTIEKMDVEVHQTGYTYGIKFAENIIFYKYDIINKGSKDLSGVYFNLYTDIDVGNISGGDPEYEDDKIGFDKERNLLYFYDDGFSVEWPQNKTGYFGVSFIKTPTINNKELGITDMHYNLYFDDRDIDSVQYGIMSSDPNLLSSDLGPAYFHLGENSDNIHYDDVSTIPETGLDIVANIASGPYDLAIGDTVTIYTALMAGWNLEDLIESWEVTQLALDLDFELSKPPITPNLSGSSSNNQNVLYWNDVSESSIDPLTGIQDFAGYKLYKSNDLGVIWSEIADYNKDSRNGLQYSYTDNLVTNGFEYWYSITAYDKGDSVVSSLETPKGTSPEGSVNLISLTPVSLAAGFNPVSVGTIKHDGSGNSNYVFNVQPINDNSLGNNTYVTNFDYIMRAESGDLTSQFQTVILDSSKTDITPWGINFISSNQLEIINLELDEVLEPSPKPFRRNRTYELNDGLGFRFLSTIPDEILPEAEDYITIKFGVRTVKNNADTVIDLRPFLINQKQATYDGVIFTVIPPEIVSNISRIGGNDEISFTFSVQSDIDITNSTYVLDITGSGLDQNGKGFINMDIRFEDGTLIREIDSLFNAETIDFGGIRATAEFSSGDLPNSGNRFSVTTEVPIEPNITDQFTFDILNSSIDENKVKTEISNIKVVPNPYIVGSLYEPEFGELRQEPLRQIQFTKLPNECTIKIFTIDADLVKTIYHSAQNGTAVWDLRSESGREIAPGMYIYSVEAKKLQHLGRFAVIK